MYDTLHIPFIGQKIEVLKANQIIPQIYSAEEITEGGDIFYPEKCPICGQPLTIITSDSGVRNLVCTNSACEGKLINRLDHFCGKTGLDIKGLSTATLEKLINWGWVECPADLFKLATYRKDWITKPGFGEKSVDKILNSIEASKTPSLESFISAIGIPLIGKTVSKDLVKHIKTYKELRNLVMAKFDFSQFDGFAEAKTENILKFDYTDADAVYELITIPEPEITVSHTPLEGMTIVITGKLTHFKNRAELQSIIEQKGGKVTNSVTKNTNILINNDTTSTTAKNLTAQKLGIPILTEENFYQKYLI